jgi:hypothetical protein
MIGSRRRESMSMSRPPVIPADPADRDHVDPRAVQEPGQAHAVRAGALDPDRGHLPKLAGLGQQPAVTGWGRWYLEHVQTATLKVDHDRGMRIGMGVDTHDDVDSFFWQVVSVLLLIGLESTTGRDGGQDS